MSSYVIIINDSPYGSQRAYNGLRVAGALSVGATVRVFLLGDGVTCGLAGLTPAHEDYNPQALLEAILDGKGEIAACKTCLDARGIALERLMTGIQKGSLDQLVGWSEAADKVISF